MNIQVCLRIEEKHIIIPKAIGQCQCLLNPPDDHGDVVLPKYVTRSRLHQLRQHRSLEQLRRLQRHLAASHVIARGDVQLRLLFEELSQERVSHTGGGELGRDLVQVHHLGVVTGTTTAAMTYCEVEDGKLFLGPIGRMGSNVLGQIHLLHDGQIQIRQFSECQIQIQIQFVKY